MVNCLVYKLFKVTWRRRDSQNLLTEACVLLCGVQSVPGVQSLIHFSQNDLPQVKQTCRRVTASVTVFVFQH